MAPTAPFPHVFCRNPGNLSGVGDTTRRIGATERRDGGNIRRRGWTLAWPGRYAQVHWAPSDGAPFRLEGAYRLRAVAAGSKALLGVLALSWGACGLAASGTQSTIVAQHGTTAIKSPSIALLRQQTTLASTCSGSAFDVNTFINVDTAASADVKVTAPGVGQIEEFTDETGANIGPYSAVFPTFHILAFGGGLPPNTPITITITTYSGTNLGGDITSVSSLTFNCTTGAVLSAPSAAVQVPTLSSIALAATAALLLLIGVVSLRRIKASR
jgi:hypothetical protein